MYKRGIDVGSPCSAMGINRLLLVEYEACERVVGVVGVRVLLVFLLVGVSFTWKALQHMPHESTHGTHDKHFFEDFVWEGCSVPLLLLLRSPSRRWS